MTETTPGLAGLLYAMSDEHARRLRERDDVLEALLARDWAVVEQQTLRDLDALQERIALARAQGRTVSPAWLYQEQRYRDLLANVAQQAERYGGAAAATVTDAQAWAAGQGAQDAMASVGASAGVRVDALTPPVGNVATAAGFLADGSPLTALFAGSGTATAFAARDVLVTAVATGWGADRTARALRDAVGLTHTRAVTVARTELHRVYREATRATYQANRDVVTGWTWRAALDRRCCTGCMAMDGTVHDVDERLDGHPRCRCAMVPLTRSWADLGLEGLEDAERPAGGRARARLDAMSPAEQDRALGPVRGRLYRRGQIDLPDMVTRTYDPRWGTMRREATVTEARGHAAARGVRQTIDRLTPAVGTQPARRKTATEQRAEARAIHDAKMAAMRAEAAELRARQAALRSANLRAGARLRGIPEAVRANG